jgi:predicted TPR repeat methyltransferase
MSDPEATSPTGDTVAASEVDAVAAAAERNAQIESGIGFALMANPENVSALMQMGDHMAAQDRSREAADWYRSALAVKPEHTGALIKLGTLLHWYPAFQEEAITLLQQAVVLDPTVIAAYRPLASSLEYSGRHAEAVAALRAWRAASPEDADVAHMLAAYSHEEIPDRANDDFVQHTFDKAAEKFDALLRDTLQYRAPEALMAHLEDTLPEKMKGRGPLLDILDLGCGTGLGASLLRPHAIRLVGVDLSPKMLAKAGALALYDELATAELTAYLAACKADFDLLFAADTLVYFGRLEEVFVNAFAALRSGGCLAFTVEFLHTAETGEAVDGAPSGFVLTATGRYQQSEHYVRQALQSAGFAASHIIKAQLRTENDKPMIGLVVIAVKSEDTDH